MLTDCITSSSSNEILKGTFQFMPIDVHGQGIYTDGSHYPKDTGSNEELPKDGAPVDRGDESSAVKEVERNYPVSDEVSYFMLS